MSASSEVALHLNSIFDTAVVWINPIQTVFQVAMTQVQIFTTSCRVSFCSTWSFNTLDFILERLDQSLRV